jgi:hypothetical protein
MKRATIAARLVLLAAGLMVIGGIALPETSDDAALAQRIAEGLIAACPPADPGDEKARDLCAEKLTQFKLLRDSLSDPIYWGGHKAGTSYAPEESQLTLFNPFVWRRMYLSLFMFSGTYRIERADPYTVLHVPYQFRNQLDIGAYPYPFWHSKAKWDSYQLATELLLVFQDGKIVAAYRSEKQDKARSYVPHVWDGRWQWIDKNGREMPYVSLYTYLFSPSNPHVERLDAAYRALEAVAREQSCNVCHSPSNPTQMNPLRLLNFPNQALTMRHNVVTQIEQNLMPLDTGIPDGTERKRLLALAQEFAAVGDQALDYEGEFKPPDRQ